MKTEPKNLPADNESKWLTFISEKPKVWHSAVNEWLITCKQMHHFKLSSWWKDRVFNVQNTEYKACYIFVMSAQ